MGSPERLSTFPRDAQPVRGNQQAGSLVFCSQGLNSDFHLIDAIQGAKPGPASLQRANGLPASSEETREAEKQNLSSPETAGPN